MRDCRHLRLSPEACAIEADGRERPVLVHLCAWNPGWRIPPWCAAAVTAGQPVEPDRDCASCPVWEQEHPVASLFVGPRRPPPPTPEIEKDA